MDRLAFLSDLHLEASGLDLDVGNATLVAVVGDAWAPHGALKGPRAEHEGVWWLRDRLPDRPVLLVPGNHDYEGSRPEEALAAMRRAAEGSQVTVLWNEAVTLNGVRYLGTPLWSDPTQGRADGAAILAQVEMLTDLNRSYDAAGKPLTGAWLLEQHRQARAFLAKELAQAAREGTPTVVLTHWAPSPRSQAPEHAAKPMAGYWATDCEDLVAQATLWLHGHIHDTVDYRVGPDPTRGRVRSNPRGWSRTFGLATNPAFRQPCIVDLAREPGFVPARPAARPRP